MDDAGTRQPDPPEENGMRGPLGDPENSGVDADPKDRTESSSDLRSLTEEMARFRRLSSEMTDCLSSVIRKTEDVADTLGEIRNSIERKKRELKEIYAIEACAASMKALEEEHRIQREKFAASMEDRRRQWAEEENLRLREEEEYRESLRRRRQQQQEYERKMVEEQSLLRSKMEEELRKFLQEARDKQRMIEEDLQRRERALNSREEECGRLIGELESFIEKLAARKGKADQGMPSPTNTAHGTRAYSGQRHPSADAGPPSDIGIGDIYTGEGESLKGEDSPPLISVRRMLLQRPPRGAARLTGKVNRDSHTLENKS